MINYDESPCQLFSQTCVSYGISQRVLPFPSTRFTNSFQADFPMRRRLASEAFRFRSLFPRKPVTTKRFVTIDLQFRSVSRRSRVCPCHLHAKLRCKYFSPFSRVPSSHQLFPLQPVLFPLLSFVLECDSFPSLPVCHSFAPALHSYPSSVVLPNSLLFPFPLLPPPPSPSVSLSFYPFAAILPLVFSTRKPALFPSSFILFSSGHDRVPCRASALFLNAFVKEQNAYAFSFSAGRSAASEMPLYFPENSIVSGENALFSRLIGQRCFSRGAIRPGLVRRM